MRADRLISIVLLLRRHGRTTAGGLAGELGVSSRTVLRDLEALSVAGVPVYAERGRHGGFSLLPGWEADLAGLTDDEALALLVVGRGPGGRALGLGSALSSGVGKVVDALPATHRAAAGEASQRVLVDPGADLVTPVPSSAGPPAEAVAEVRRAVLGGRRLRLLYAAAGAPARWRTVDPIGLVTVRDRVYLLATRDGADRTYRLSRVLDASRLDEPARRPDAVDLDRLWQERCAQYLSQVDPVTAVVSAPPGRLDDVARAALAVQAGEQDATGTVQLRVTFQDVQHAEWALWQLVEDIEVHSPASLRAGVRDRARAVAARHS